MDKLFIPTFTKKSAYKGWSRYKLHGARGFRNLGVPGSGRGTDFVVNVFLSFYVVTDVIRY